MSSSVANRPAVQINVSASTRCVLGAGGESWCTGSRLVASLIHRSQVQCRVVRWLIRRRAGPTAVATLAASPVGKGGVGHTTSFVCSTCQAITASARHPRENPTPSCLLPIVVRLTKNLYSSRWQYMCYCLWDCRKRCYSCQGPMQHSGQQQASGCGATANSRFLIRRRRLASD